MPAPVFPGLFYFQSVKELFNIQGFTPFRSHSKGTISLRAPQVFCVKIDLENHIYLFVFQSFTYINFVRNWVKNSPFSALCTTFRVWVCLFRQKNNCKGCAWFFTAREWVFFAGVLLAAINPPGRQAARGSDPPGFPLSCTGGRRALIREKY